MSSSMRFTGQIIKGMKNSRINLWVWTRTSWMSDGRVFCADGFRGMESVSASSSISFLTLGSPVGSSTFGCAFRRDFNLPISVSPTANTTPDARKTTPNVTDTCVLCPEVQLIGFECPPPGGSGARLFVGGDWLLGIFKFKSAQSAHAN